MHKARLGPRISKFKHLAARSEKAALPWKVMLNLLGTTFKLTLHTPISPPQMADFEYDLVTNRSELLSRPDQTLAVKGQAGFLAVALALDIPILGQRNSLRVDGNPVLAGAGASFSVARSISAFEPDPVQDLVNETTGAIDWYKSDKVKRGFRRFVTKTLVPPSVERQVEQNLRDAEHLAAIINEIRILANESIRSCPFVVSLLCVSWHECPTSDGRFWPQLVLEAADYGTLEDYLTTEKPDFTSQLILLKSIGRGLAFVHAHGIVHGDLKLENILVFAEGREPQGLELVGNGSQRPIEAKIADFGFAIILDDYPDDAVFQAQVGTRPWMAPELEQRKPVPLKELYKADLYSFGLVAASIFTQSLTPFPTMSEDQISSAKNKSLTEPGSVLTIILENIENSGAISEIQQEYIEALLAGTCEREARLRICLPALDNYLLLGMVQGIGDGPPRVSLDHFTPFLDASPGYYNALRAFNRMYASMEGQNVRAFASPIPANPLVLGLQDNEGPPTGEQSELREFIRSMQALRIGSPANDPSQATRIRSFARVGRVSDEAHFNQVSGRAMQRVPDLAYEHEFCAALLQRVAGDEIIRDLKTQASSEHLDDPAVAFQLAGCYLNGQIVAPDMDQGLSYLNRAVEMGYHDAIAVATNIYDACECPMPEYTRDIIRERMASQGAVSVMKSSSLVFSLHSPRRTDLEHIFAQTWAENWPHEYATWLATDDMRLVNSSMALLNNPAILHAEVPSNKQPFDFTQLGYFQKFGPAKFDPVRRKELIEDVARFSCLESPDDMGFTLLQTAVVKDDLNLVKILVRDMGADVNGYGNTYSWTPLLLACQCGHFAIAQWLSEQGANAACRDLRGASILHTLHHFTTREQCSAVAQWALAAGVDINCRHREGLTPLHATFLGWDFSCGAAAEVLLDHGADPCSAARGFDGFFNRISPVGLCAERLNNGLLRRMLSIAAEMHETNRGLAPSKAQAFYAMAEKTRFDYMGVGGRDYEARLVSVLRLLVDDEMSSYLGSALLGSRDACFCLALYSCRGVFVEAMLTAFPDFNVNRIPGHAVQNAAGLVGGPFIQIATERRALEAVRSLVRRGADLLMKGNLDLNCLHIAARFFPSILPELVDVIADLPPEQRYGKSVKGVLEAPNADGLTIFGLLLLEGYADEQQIAETLRTEYGLEYDYRILSEDGNWQTLTAYLICIAVNSALVPVDQIRYLLDLTPPPQFVCASDGSTLLTTAIAGVMNCKSLGNQVMPLKHEKQLPMLHLHLSSSRVRNKSAVESLTVTNGTDQTSDELPAHQLVSMILERYGTYANILSGPSESTALHIAAFWANRKAIEKVANHIIIRHPEESLPWNSRAVSGNTVLDFARHEVGNIKLGSESDVVMDRMALKAKKEAAVDCYKFLRGEGAIHAWELKGNCFA
ncbi:hypothetical protein HZ326_24618 [Fusarium oxysporum f. sp. albedinis]|nr:hypothetical protein HZ326_24618 [Fusarium oxysporum f. sp. albedinis]